MRVYSILSQLKHVKTCQNLENRELFGAVRYKNVLPKFNDQMFRSSIMFLEQLNTANTVRPPKQLDLQSDVQYLNI